MSGLSLIVKAGMTLHLDAWLVRTVPEDDHTKAVDDILCALDEYPDLIKDRSWAEIRAVGERMRQRAAA